MRRKGRYPLIIAIAVGIVATAAVYLAAEQVEQKLSSDSAPHQEASMPLPTEDPVQGVLKLNGEKYAWTHEIENYLVIGTDASGNQTENEDEYRGTMADFLLILAVDRTDHTFSMIQLNRDTITEVTLLQADGSGLASAEMQICTAHWYGGDPVQSCENTVEAVSKLLGGLPIKGYYSLNMKDIPSLNHAVGGVTVTIEDDFSKVDPSLRQGRTLKLSDEQAFTYVHDRYDVGDQKNSSRMKRQQSYMKGFWERAQEKNEEDPAFVTDLYQQLEETAVTDLTGKDISRLVRELNRSANRGIYCFEGKEKIGQRLNDGINHVEFFINDESRLRILKEIYGLMEYKRKK